MCGKRDGPEILLVTPPKFAIGFSPIFVVINQPPSQTFWHTQSVLPLSVPLVSPVTLELGTENTNLGNHPKYLGPSILECSDTPMDDNRTTSSKSSVDGDDSLPAPQSQHDGEVRIASRQGQIDKTFSEESQDESNSRSGSDKQLSDGEHVKADVDVEAGEHEKEEVIGHLPMKGSLDVITRLHNDRSIMNDLT